MEITSDHIRRLALKRMHQIESQLIAQGVHPVAGMELEFFPIWREDKEGNAIRPHYMDSPKQTTSFFESVNTAFKDSPFIEKMYYESKGKWEIVIGGVGKAVKIPDSRLLPSVISNANEAVRRTIEKKSLDKQYDIDGIMYDASAYGNKEAGQHCSISLWTKDGRPLFQNLSNTHGTQTNLLTIACAKQLLDAQHALIAAIIPNDKSLNRFGTHSTIPNAISLDNKKRGSASVNLRRSSVGDEQESLYLENRLPGAEVMPALAMLMTLGGIERGVEEYKRESSDIRLEHICDKSLKLEPKNLPVYKMPNSRESALAITENSVLAKEIMGEELFNAFCKWSRQENKAPKLNTPSR